jgi:hypothetical protein
MTACHFPVLLSGAVRRGVRAWPAWLLAASALLAAGPARAVGSMVDVDVVERDSGSTLQIHPFRGAYYVAGRPGTRYAIRVSNRTGSRVLAVMSVDGVNIVTGQTAAWNQSGYVLEPWQTHEITGWRKSQQEVAAFEFTALPDSYAARTGRPQDVGVIGVAVFTEQPAPPPPVPAPEASRDESRRYEDAAGTAQAAGKLAERSDRAAAPVARLGTGHGAREESYAARTTFVRSSSQPVELVSVQYDRYENLVRAGVVPERRTPPPHPFPRSGSPGYVPDPPQW